MQTQDAQCFPDSFSLTLLTAERVGLSAGGNTNSTDPGPSEKANYFGAEDPDLPPGANHIGTNEEHFRLFLSHGLLFSSGVCW